MVKCYTGVPRKANRRTLRFWVGGPHRDTSPETHCSSAAHTHTHTHTNTPKSHYNQRAPALATTKVVRAGAWSNATQGSRERLIAGPYGRGWAGGSNRSPVQQHCSSTTHTHTHTHTSLAPTSACSHHFKSGGSGRLVECYTGVPRKANRRTLRSPQLASRAIYPEVSFSAADSAP